MHIEKLFPGIPDLPASVIEAAALIASYDMDTLAAEYPEWRYLNSGAYNVAYTNGEYVLKTKLRGEPYTAETFAKNWLLRHPNTDPAVYDFMKQILVPTECLFDDVIVQEMVAVVALEDEDMDNQTILLMEMIGHELNMSDVHSGNWGIHTDNSLRVFDPMAMWRAPRITERKLRTIMKKYVRLVDRIAAESTNRAKRKAA